MTATVFETLPAVRPHRRALLFVPSALLVGALVAVDHRLALLATAGAAVFVGTLLRPALGGCAVVALTPLLVGIDRGRLVPGARPNEALVALVAGALLLRALLRHRPGDRLQLQIGPVATALVLMAVANSVLPLAWRAWRGLPITADDVLYALVLWKYLALYAVVRASLRTAADVLRCAWLLLASATVVAVLAVLQALNLFGVPGLLAVYYAPFGDTGALYINRGSSTLSLAAATADLMLLCLALVAGLAARRIGPRRVLAAVAVVVLLGVFASGQFSGIIGLLVALVMLLVVTRRRRLFLPLLPVLALAPLPLWPVVERRLQGFAGLNGWPESWVGRYNNLNGYFWPELFSDGNVLLGVRPAARVPGPRELGIDWVWIESGHTWLLWGGGLPLLGAYLLFTVAVFRCSWRWARDGSGVYGAVATAVLVGMCFISVLMLFDPHITYRGAADTFFALLAMLAGAPLLSPAPAAAPPPEPVRRAR